MDDFLNKTIKRKDTKIFYKSFFSASLRLGVFAFDCLNYSCLIQKKSACGFLICIEFIMINRGVTLFGNPMLEQFLKELCEELEITSIIKPNEKKLYELEVVSEVFVTFKDLNPGVWMEGKLFDSPKKKREDLFISLMQANLLGQGTGGSVIGLDKDEKFLTLSLALSYEINYRGFKDNLEDFVNYFLYWRDKIKKAKEEDSLLL